VGVDAIPVASTPTNALAAARAADVEQALAEALAEALAATRARPAGRTEISPA